MRSTTEFDRQKEEFEKIGDVNILSLSEEISKFSNLFFKISKRKIYPSRWNYFKWENLFHEINHRRTLGTFCYDFARKTGRNYQLNILKNKALNGRALLFNAD